MTREDILALCEADPRDEETAQRALAWQIEDRDTLEWALGVLAAAEKEREQIHLAADAARSRIAQREADLGRSLDRSTAFLRSAMEGYARSHRKELLSGRGAKTAQFLHGTIQYRRRPEGIEIETPAATLEWCKAQPVEADMVRTTIEINKRALKAHVMTTGEIPPGVAFIPAQEDIVIRPEAPDAIEAAPSRREIA